MAALMNLGQVVAHNHVMWISPSSKHIVHFINMRFPVSHPSSTKLCDVIVNIDWHWSSAVINKIILVILPTKTLVISNRDSWLMCQYLLFLLFWWLFLSIALWPWGLGSLMCILFALGYQHRKSLAYMYTFTLFCIPTDRTLILTSLGASGA